MDNYEKQTWPGSSDQLKLLKIFSIFLYLHVARKIQVSSAYKLEPASDSDWGRSLQKTLELIMKKVETTQNFFLAFTDELEKQICIKKLLKWANKRQNNFNIYNAALKKKQQQLEISLFYTFVPKLFMI